MISPMPDVKTLELTPEDSFMIIACDGIWNSLSSQEACEFVSSRMKPDTNLSTICEEVNIYICAIIERMPYWSGWIRIHHFQPCML